MIHDFKDLLRKAESQNLEVSNKDINFFFLNEFMGEQKTAYQLAQNRVEKPKKSDTYSSSNLANSVKYEFLRNELKSTFDRLLNKHRNRILANTKNTDVELQSDNSVIDEDGNIITMDDLKSVLSKIINNSDDSSQKLQAIKILIDKFDISADNDKELKHIIKLPPKSPCVCRYCGREV